jgi:hypothetical protein
MIVVLLLALGAVAFLGNMKIDRVLRQSAASGQKAADAKTAADAAESSAAATAGLLQSIGQALNAGVANGTLTPQQLQAIAAAIAANQAAKGAAKAQAGTTPGIPGSRSGGGRSVTPGVLGSAMRPVASQTIPPPHSSSTAGCLLTVNSQVFTLDGTVCPP